MAFQLDLSAKKEWHLRKSEQVIFELMLDTESFANYMRRSSLCKTSCLAVCMPCLCPLSVYAHCVQKKQAKTYEDTKIFFTNEAIYAYSGPNDENEPMAGCCSGGGCCSEQGYSIRKRLAYEDIAKVETEQAFSSIFWDGTRQDNYDALKIYSKDAKLVVTVRTQGGSPQSVSQNVVDDKGIAFQLVYHAKDIEKVIQFIVDKKSRQEEIDWHEIKDQMKSITAAPFSQDTYQNGGNVMTEM